jgi:hypothetical protein
LGRFWPFFIGWASEDSRQKDLSREALWRRFAPGGPISVGQLKPGAVKSPRFYLSYGNPDLKTLKDYESSSLLGFVQYFLKNPSENPKKSVAFIGF